MKASKYIISNDFYIKNDLSSFMIYFDYFISPNLSLTKFIQNTFLRRIAYIFLRTVVIILITSQIYKLRYKVTFLNENAILIFKGSGKWSNIIRLEKQKDKMIVKKIVFNKKIFEKEKAFYNKYKTNKSKIKLPTCKFIAPNIIEMDFLQMNSFRRLIVNGTFDLKTSLKHFKKIKNELSKLYKTDPSLIHGDFWSTNIFIDNGKYYLIDYSDTITYSPNYDFYVLLYSILSSYNFISNNEKSIMNHNHKDISIINQLKVDLTELERIEKHFNIYRAVRFS